MSDLRMRWQWIEEFPSMFAEFDITTGTGRNRKVDDEWNSVRRALGWRKDGMPVPALVPAVVIARAIVKRLVAEYVTQSIFTLNHGIDVGLGDMIRRGDTSVSADSVVVWAGLGVVEADVPEDIASDFGRLLRMARCDAAALG